MKKPERMKNKTTKAFLYQNLYPVNLYVTTLDDWEDACLVREKYSRKDIMKEMNNMLI